MHLPDHPARFLLSHGTLLWRVTRAELRARYAGSLLGIGWAIITPLLTLGIYGVVYAAILAVRVPGFSPLQYVLFIFAGLVPFLMTAEALSFGVSSVVANKAVLSNTVFPIDLAAPKVVLGSQVTMLSGLVVLLPGLLATGFASWTILLLPMVWILHLMAIVGLIWIVSLINVVFRDLQNLISAILMILFIASPIAYTPEMVPPGLLPIITFNPLAPFIISYQDILIMGTIPNIPTIISILILGITSFILGGWFFVKAKRVLVDYV